jgi:hypothetical protein
MMHVPVWNRGVAVPAFCDKRLGAGTACHLRVGRPDGGSRSVLRIQQAPGRPTSRARREAVVWLRVGRLSAVSTPCCLTSRAARRRPPVKAPSAEEGAVGGPAGRPVVTQGQRGTSRPQTGREHVLAGAGQCRRRASQSATYTSATRTGTSISGPTTPARAWPEVAPPMAPSRPRKGARARSILRSRGGRRSSRASASTSSFTSSETAQSWSATALR